MLLVTFQIRTVYINDEWSADSGEESTSDGNFFTKSFCLVDKSIKDYDADEQKFEEMVLKEAYNTDNTMKPHYFSPSYCPVHVSEDKWDWSRGKDFFLDREDCIDCNYPVLLKLSTDSTLEISLLYLDNITTAFATRLSGVGIPRLDLTGYDNLSKSEVYTKYYNEEMVKNDS
tara:strand:+ start:380 stop:898 length:519 start_codon:yes stop_codon:yes gene_type:complete